MDTPIKSEFQSIAVPGEELARRLAYLASQDNGSVLTGGFAKDGIALDRGSDGRPRGQAASAMEFFAQQEQQQRLAAMASRIDALEQAAREALIDAENDLATILSNANRATDGRAVFKDKDGNIRDEDGQIVDETEVDMSDWDSDAPTWESMEDAVTKRDAAAENLDRVTETSARWESGDPEAADLDQWDSGLDDLEAAILGYASSVESPELGDSANIERPGQDTAPPSDGPNQTFSAPLPG
ncbi:MAG: hypothetical protein NXH88_17760 [Hyphomonas sp.]|nr:hypothetical protein [Hyphomonas sp.]